MDKFLLWQQQHGAALAALGDMPICCACHSGDEACRLVVVAEAITPILS